MRGVFIIITGVLGVVIAYLYPLVAVLCGKRLFNVVIRTWACLVVYFVFLCLVLPGVISLASREFGAEMLRSWVPDMPAIGALVFVGWLPPLVAGLIALVVRWLLSTFWPASLSIIDRKRPMK